jgi:hypothetical protein
VREEVTLDDVVVLGTWEEGAAGRGRGALIDADSATKRPSGQAGDPGQRHARLSRRSKTSWAQGSGAS